LINFFENTKFESKYNWLFSKNYFLFSLLERRLDLLIYRAGFVFSLYEARQYISHGFICLNLAILKNNLFILKRGDIISLNFNLRKRLRYKKLFFFNKRLLKRSLISYKHFEANHLTFKIILIANLVNRKQSMVFLKKKINFTLSFI
jgi:small subunit ribosomal protein S4